MLLRRYHDSLNIYSGNEDSSYSVQLEFYQLCELKSKTKSKTINQEAIYHVGAQYRTFIIEKVIQN